MGITRRDTNQKEGAVSEPPLRRILEPSLSIVLRWTEYGTGALKTRELAFFEGHIVALGRAGVNLARAIDAGAGVFAHLLPLGDPSR